jgi:hypothetical protein
MKYGFFDRLVDLFDLTRRAPRESRRKDYWSVFVDGEFLTVMFSRRDQVLDYVKTVLACDQFEIDEDHFTVLCTHAKAITLPDAKSLADRK